MRGEFQRVITSDGLELHGLLVEPEAKPSAGIIHIHGLAGNFYENRFIDHLAALATRLGIAFLTTNNRGRDYISDSLCITDSGSTYKQIGGAYEIFEECLIDLDAWIALLMSRGVRSMILQGHSHGALKVAYYIMKKPNPAISGIILLSPSDDFGLQRAELGERFDEALEVARRMIAQGRSRDFMPPGYFHYPVSAATYYDMFRPDSPLKIFNLSETDTSDFKDLGSIRIPTLAIVGSVGEAFIGSPDEYLSAMRSKMNQVQDFRGRIVKGAPHNYLGYETSLAGVIEGWLVDRLEWIGKREGDAIG